MKLLVNDFMKVKECMDRGKTFSKLKRNEEISPITFVFFVSWIILVCPLSIASNLGYEIRSQRIINAVDDFPCIIETSEKILSNDKEGLVLCWKDNLGEFRPVESDWCGAAGPGLNSQELIFFPAKIPIESRKSLYLVPKGMYKRKTISTVKKASLNWSESEFLVRLKDENKDAFILKDFPSFNTVLHDVGFKVGKKFISIYGWWSTCDFMVDEQWYSLSSPSCESVSVTKPDYYYYGSLFERVVLTASSTFKKHVKVSTSHDFFAGFSAVRLIRRFWVDGQSQDNFGPIGLWFGGQARDFPTYNTKSPTSYYYCGQWYDQTIHLFGSSLKSDNNKDYKSYVIIYWDEYDTWLAMLIDERNSDDIFAKPEFFFRLGNFTAPSWQKATGLFRDGVLTSWYVVGKSDKQEAVQRVDSYYNFLQSNSDMQINPIEYESAISIAAGHSSDTKLNNFKSRSEEECSHIKIKSPYCQFKWDKSAAAVSSLNFDPDGSENYGKDWLEGENAIIYFNGGSQWQRSLDWTDTNDRMYVIDSNGAFLSKTGDNQLKIENILLNDPEDGRTFYSVVLEITASKTQPVLKLKAIYNTKIDNSYPYLGWHLDFPKDTFTHFTTRFLIENISRWKLYRMGYKDLQPMRCILDEKDLGAFSVSDDSDEALKFSFVMAETDVKSTACNLPNPLFDDPKEIQKVGLTATYLFWRYHNMAGIEQKVGQKRTITAVVQLSDENKLQQIDKNYFKVDLPHAPEMTKFLNDYWIQHCRGGVYNLEGVNSWWHSISNKFNPKLPFERWKSDLKRYLRNPSSGNIKTGCGWIVPKGALPIIKGATDFNWNGGYIFEVNAHIIMSAEQYYLASGDKSFLNDMIDELESAAQFYLDLSNSDGVITLPFPFDGVSNPVTCYWDGWHIGHMSCFTQMYANGAIKALARMEKQLGRIDKAKEYKTWASRLNKQLIDIYWREGNLIDNSGNTINGGRLISWININNEKIDAAFTDLNLMAVYLGLLPEHHVKKVFEWIDNDPHAYAWRDRITGEKVGIITFNTIDGNSERVYVDGRGPIRYYAGAFNPFSVPPGMENGQIQYWVSGFDFENRCRYGMADLAVKNLERFSKRYSRGDLNSGHGVPESRPLPMFQGTSQMSPIDLPCGSDQSLGEDGMVYTMGLVSGIFGLRYDYNGLYVRPDIPEMMRDAEILNMRYQTRRFSVKFVGYGKNVEKIVVDGKENSNRLYIFDFQRNNLDSQKQKNKVYIYLESTEASK